MEESHDDGKRNIITVVAVLLVILIVIGAYFMFRKPAAVVCGDGLCGKNEKAACCSDCECARGTVCNAQTQMCESPSICGDGACSQGELCCEECGCPGRMWCNPASHACESTTSALCNNQVCDPGESEMSCCSDCGCATEGYACNKNTNSCAPRGNVRVCGDGVCDWGENVNFCCDDCGVCELGSHCDKQKHMCVPNAATIDQALAIQAFKVFLVQQGEDAAYVDSFSYTATPEAFEGQPVLQVCRSPTTPGGRDRVCARVNERYDVSGYVRFW